MAAISSKLQAKADEKLAFIQKFLENLDAATLRNETEDRAWLQTILDPKDPCIRTLVSIAVTHKYAMFTDLRSAALRTIAIILRVAVSFASPATSNGANAGLQCLVEMAGEQPASEARSEICRMADCQDDSKAFLSCDALLVLAELGPEALEPRLVPRSLGLLVALPHRAIELVELSLRVHAWGGEHREALLETALLQQGGHLLWEILMQIVNRSDPTRTLRALKVLSGILSRPSSRDFVYTNDVCVLVEILVRELPVRVGNAASLAVYADCFKALIMRCQVAREHRSEEAMSVLRELTADEQLSSTVRRKCAEVLCELTLAASEQIPNRC